jgi:2-dehydropantoate 2-reductase
MPREFLTVGVVGVGPMGTILSGCLAEAGAEIIVADLPQRIAQVKRSGLQVVRGARRFDYFVRTVDSIRALGNACPDCIVVSTKACILDKIMPEVAEAAGKDCLVISAQNGIGTEDAIARHVPRENVARMVINYAAECDDEGVAHVAWFNPPNFFGHLTREDDARLVKVVEMLDSVNVPTDLVDPVTIKKSAFFKTVLNSALMPVCAVMGLTMREALDQPATHALAEDLVKEGLAVAERLDYYYGENVVERCMGYLEGGGDHHPSMSKDLQNRRPTEIDFLNGKILEIGCRFPDLQLVVNRVLVSMIMTWEVRNGTRSPADIPCYLGGERAADNHCCETRIEA